MWGSANLRSCDGLIRRLERNDPQLVDVVILPSKTFGPDDVERLATILERGGGRGGGRSGNGAEDEDEKTEDAVASGAVGESRSGGDASSTRRTYYWRSLSASSHPLPPESLARLGRAIATSSLRSTRNQEPDGPVLVGLAVGDETTGDDGIRALCRDGFMKSVRTSISTDESNGVPSSYVSLEWLDLSRKGMTERGFADVVLCLRDSRRLRQLNVGHNHLSRRVFVLDDDAVDSTLWNGDPTATGWFPALEDLDLSYCQLEPDFVCDFFPRLGSGSTPELRLHVSGNPSLQDAGFQHVWEALGSRLVELDVSGCGLGDNAVELLCDDSVGAAVLPLRVLNLSDNSITAKGGMLLGQALCGTILAHLTELYLARNPMLGPDGVTVVVDGLKDRRQQQLQSGAATPLPTSVQVLDVSSTMCSSSPAVALRAIQHSGVETLLLHGNQLGMVDGGFALLAQGLRGGHDTLRYLDLSANGANERSVVALLDSVAMMTTTEGVESDDETLSLSLPTSSVLTTLVVGGNEIGRDVDAAVIRAQARHPDLVVPRR